MKKLTDKKFIPFIMLNVCTILLVALMLVVNQVTAKSDQASTTQTLNTGVLSYQGVLMDTTGNPISGLIDITFRIYSSPSGTTMLWEEIRSGGNAVPVQNGLFNVLLGSLNPLPDSLSGYSQLFLGIKIGTDAEMSPRTEIVGNFMSGGGIVSGIPVGSVISWWRPDANMPLPSDGWVIADGSVVTDSSSPLYGTTLPDLRDKFVMGVSAAAIGQTGGTNTLNLSHQHQVDGHTHTIPNHAHSDGGLYAYVALEDDRAYVIRSGPGFSSTNANYTSTSHTNTHITDSSADIGGITGYWSGTSGSSLPMTSSILSSTTENRPAYVGLVYLVKIK